VKILLKSVKRVRSKFESEENAFVLGKRMLLLVR
jgi:hypothetical protein